MLFAVLMNVLSVEEEDRFQTLYREYNNLMYYIAYEIVRDRDATEEILQDTYVKVIQNFHLFAGGVNDYSKNLLAVITRNTAFDFLRQQKRKKQWEEEVNLQGEEQEMDLYQRSEPAGQSAEELYLLKATSEELVEAIRSLPEKERNVIELRYWGHLKRKEIAELLSISEPYVKKLIRNGLNHLKANLGEKYKE